MYFRKRIGAFLIDHFIISFIFIPPYILMELNGIETLRFGFFSLPYVALLCKDLFGTSIGKKVMGLKITFDFIPSSSKEKFIKLIVRNIPLLLWPIEGIVIWGGSPKRIGDKLAGTTVEETI